MIGPHGGVTRGRNDDVQRGGNEKGAHPDDIEDPDEIRTGRSCGGEDCTEQIGITADFIQQRRADEKEIFLDVSVHRVNEK